MSTLALTLVSFVILRCRFEASLSQGCVAMAPRQSPGSKEEGEALKSECQSVALSSLLQAVAKIEKSKECRFCAAVTSPY